MNKLRVEISTSELEAILHGESSVVEFPLQPDIFHTCCDMMIAGRKFYSIEEAMENPELKAWLEENELEILPVRFEALLLCASESGVFYEMPVEDITMAYINDEDGNPLYTLVNGIEYRKIMMKYQLKPSAGRNAIKVSFDTEGTCSRRIDVELEDGVVINVNFDGGCQGNLQGISSLVKGMKAEEAITRLSGIRCGEKSTSCPDQLARALARAIQQ